MKTLGEEKEPEPRSLSRPPKGEAASFAYRAYCLKNILRKDKENIVVAMGEGWTATPIGKRGDRHGGVARSIQDQKLLYPPKRLRIR